MEDNDPTSLSRSGWLEDTSKVEKYVMSEEDYAKREGTYRYTSVVGATFCGRMIDQHVNELCC